MGKKIYGRWEICTRLIFIVNRLFVIVIPILMLKLIQHLSIRMKLFNDIMNRY